MEIILPKSNHEFYGKWYDAARKTLATRNQKFVSLKIYDDNRTLIDSAFQKIKVIIKETDSTNCYGFTQVDKIFYNDFVYMLDQCQVHQMETYMLINDTFLIFYSPPIIEPDIGEKPQRVNCATKEVNNRIRRKEQEAKDKISRLIQFKKETNPYIISIGIMLFGMLLFYFILPFIQSKRQSNQ